MISIDRNTASLKTQPTGESHNSVRVASLTVVSPLPAQHFTKQSHCSCGASPHSPAAVLAAKKGLALFLVVTELHRHSCVRHMTTRALSPKSLHRSRARYSKSERRSVEAAAAYGCAPRSINLKAVFRRAIRARDLIASPTLPPWTLPRWASEGQRNACVAFFLPPAHSARHDSRGGRML